MCSGAGITGGVGDDVGIVVEGQESRDDGIYKPVRQRFVD